MSRDGEGWVKPVGRVGRREDRPVHGQAHWHFQNCAWACHQMHFPHDVDFIADAWHAYFIAGMDVFQPDAVNDEVGNKRRYWRGCVFWVSPAGAVLAMKPRIAVSIVAGAPLGTRISVPSSLTLTEIDTVRTAINRTDNTFVNAGCWRERRSTTTGWRVGWRGLTNTIAAAIETDTRLPPLGAGVCISVAAANSVVVGVSASPSSFHTFILT